MILNCFFVLLSVSFSSCFLIRARFPISCRYFFTSLGSLALQEKVTQSLLSEGFRVLTKRRAQVRSLWRGLGFWVQVRWCQFEPLGESYSLPPRRCIAHQAVEHIPNCGIGHVMSISGQGCSALVNSLQPADYFGESRA